MKHNKKLVYILIPLVLVIWGYIGYQVVAKLQGAKEVAPDIRVEKDLSTSVKMQNDTFTLLLNYTDPFLKKDVGHSYQLGNSKSTQRNATILLPKLDINPVVAKPQIPWPTIQFNGIIENQQKKMKVAMIQIAGQDLLMKEKEVKNGVQLVKIFKDSIQLVFQGQTRFQKRN